MRAVKVTVTDAVTPLVLGDNQNRTIYINVVGNETIAVGNSAVTFADGMLVVKHTTPQEILLPINEALYAICDTGKTDDVRILLPDGD